ncbi:MAG: glycosyltransferase family 4 protein [Leptospira sp.]|nr:glycosyltransferase family 4 protein [Leptospira sp.]
MPKSMTSTRSKIAFILPRFHPEIAGGAEKLALDYALLLKEDYEIEVFTTCAKDYTTWRNEIKPGTEVWNQITIHRFPVTKERNIQEMNKALEDCLSKGFSVTREEQLSFIEKQGPCCPALIDTFLKDQNKFNLVIFVGYLYYPIVKLLPLVSIKKLIIPTFHDEPALYLPLYKEIYLPNYVYSFNAPEELLVYQNRFGQIPKHTLIGTFIENQNSSQYSNNSPADFQVTASKPESIILMTLGRMEVAKGFVEIFQFFDRWQSTYNISNLTWISIGSNHLNPKDIPSSIQIKGFVSQNEKESLIQSASLVINPSPYESFSIAMMEAWSFKTPVLVNGKSEVMRGHNIRSQGGLHYSDEISFRRTLEYLIERPELRKRLGENGYKYVQANFTKDVVSKKLKQLISKLL